MLDEFNIIASNKVLVLGEVNKEIIGGTIIATGFQRHNDSYLFVLIVSKEGQYYKENFPTRNIHVYDGLSAHLLVDGMITNISWVRGVGIRIDYTKPYGDFWVQLFDVTDDYLNQELGDDGK